MKKLEISNTHYTRLLEAFSTHLQTLNYSKDTVYGDANMLKEYLHFLIENSIDLKKTESETIKNYLDYLQKRTNVRRGGGLSIAYLKKHLSALKRFYNYLHLSGYYSVTLSFPSLPRAKTSPKVLTIKEINQLFKACGDDLYGKRNKAILAIYYGCGLRRKEGAMLDVEDLNLEREEVFVSKSKTHTQRRVPMNEGVQKYLEDYLFNAREMLLSNDTSEGALLISNRGKRMSVGAIDYALKQLIEQTQNEQIKQSCTGLHTLRHSIATHLLSAGMKLEDIARFLGHKSIDSTQIYTHLTHEIQ
jgi:integrase/recombinase XerD